MARAHQIVNYCSVYLILCFLIVACKGISQNNFIGAGISLGYKSSYQEQGAYVYSRLLNKIDLHAGYCFLGNFNGQGVAGGIRYLFLEKKEQPDPKNKLQPYFGLSYSFNNGRNVNLKDENENTIKYLVSKNQFILGDIGLMYRYVQHDPENNLNLTILIIGSVTYRVKTSKSYVQILEGNFSPAINDKLNKRVGDGFGACISLVLISNKKKVKTN